MATIALDLDHDGIRLLREVDGAWVIDGHVALEDPKLPEEMAALREQAAAHAEGLLETVLMIPASEIFYTDTEAPRGEVDRAFAAKAIEGLTACPIDETVIDWKVKDGRVYIAALDVNTLDEAEEFAVPYGFSPVRFSARPPEGRFPGRPDFGPTQFVRHREKRRAALPPVVPRPADGAEIRKLVLTGAGALGALVGLGILAFWLVTPDESVLQDLESTAVEEAPPGTGAPEEVMEEGPEEDASSEPAGDADAVAVAELETETETETIIAAPEALTEVATLTAPPAAPLPGLRVPSAAAALPARAGAPVLALANPAGDAIPGDAALEPPVAGLSTPDLAELDGSLVWLTPPAAGPVGLLEHGEDIYLASLDPPDTMEELYLLEPAFIDEVPHVGLRPPPPAQHEYDYDTRGLVSATPDGTPAPGGYVVRLGQPPILPPERPFTVVAGPDIEVALEWADLPPQARPVALVETHQRANFGGRTLDELAALTPRARPLSAQVAAARAATPGPTELAVVASIAPGVRPEGFAEAIAQALEEARQQEQETASATVTPASVRPRAPVAQPNIPTAASVARQATLENAIPLRRMNLIGVYGSQGNRRALIRLPSGRYVKVTVGDRIDGGRVAAIGDGELRYVKGGRNVTLRVPSG